MTKAIKEIAIMLLVCLVTMLILAIALYKYIPNKKNVPEINKYVASEQVKDLLEDDIDTRSDNKKVLLTYEEEDIKQQMTMYLEKPILLPHTVEL